MFRIKTALLACLLLVACFTSGISAAQTPATQMSAFTNFLAGHNDDRKIFSDLEEAVSKIRANLFQNPEASDLVENFFVMIKRIIRGLEIRPSTKISIATLEKWQTYVKSWMTQLRKNNFVSDTSFKQFAEIQNDLRKMA